MRRGFIAFGLLVAAAFGLTNCAQKESIEPVQDTVATPFEVVADFAAETKTYNDGMSTNWSAGDQIKLSYVYTFPIIGTTYEGEFDTPLTTVNGDGIFTGTLNWQSALAGLGQYVGDIEFTAVYPFEAAGVPASTVQTGLNSTAHLAGANCPLVGTVEFEASWDALTSREVATPQIVMDHVAAVVEVAVTNATDEPLVINTVSFGLATMVKASTVVEGAEALAPGETGSVYLVVDPFTTEPGEGDFRFWVNDTKVDVKVEETVSINAGKIKKMNFVYEGAEPKLYAVADVNLEMTAERVVPSVKSLVDYNFLKEWAANLKAQEDIEAALKEVLVDIAAGDLEAAYDVLGGLPGFELQSELFKASARAVVDVKYTTTEFTQSYIDEIKSIKDVDSFVKYLRKIETVYEVTIEGDILSGLGNLNDYVSNFADVLNEWFPGNDAISLAIKAIAQRGLDAIADFSFADLMEDSVKDPDGWSARILDWMFSQTAIRDAILDSVAGVVEQLEANFRNEVEDENADAKQSAIWAAQYEAYEEAIGQAGADIDAKFAQLNQNEIDKLNDGVWGIFRSILDADKTKEVFETLQITVVYDVFQEIAERIESVVMYEKGQKVMVPYFTYDEVPVVTPSQLAVYTK